MTDYTRYVDQSGKHGNVEKIVKIIVEGGVVFKGTVDQWKDCFFSNPTVSNIKSWCKDLGYDCEIITEV
jgi:hypothetical protein